ncbi:MAG: hypothetical protein F4077_09480 [Gammaproteobacteria bacterium]|nr:hypothetical protein [Gammaproteobacteria bacterium]MYI77966.1 hypothetical protein [Gammaproteobacteria bacterium]
MREWNGNRFNPTLDRWNPITYQLPANHSGVGSSVNDFKVNNVVPYNKIPFENGAHSDRQFASVNLRHEFFDTLELVTDIFYYDNTSFQRKNFTDVEILVPANNAYNPFGRHMIVRYIPTHEHKQGLLSQPYDNASSEQFTATFAVNYRFRSKQEPSVHYQVHVGYRGHVM